MIAALPLEKRKFTLAEFEQIPIGPPYFEYDEGEIVELASPTFNHQDILGELNAETRFHLRKHRTGRVFIEVDVYLPDGKVFVPDMGFLSTQNLDMLWESDGKIHGAPDLVVEITSQDANRDRVRKFRVYHANGIQWYWIVDQETLEIEEYGWTEAGYKLRGRTGAREVFRPEVFPEMEINLAANLGVLEEGAGE